MFVVTGGIDHRRGDFLASLDPLADSVPTSAVEFKFDLIYMWTTTKPTLFIFEWLFS